MATVSFPAEQRLILDGVEWADYMRMLRAIGNRPGVRLTYDRGSLEIMTLSHEHESYAHLLGRLVVGLTEALLLPIKGGKSTTFRRRRRRRGLEPDECYWIASESLVRGKDRINLKTDPPPDLGLEIDITHSSLDRLAIYAALRIPEVWRLEGRRIVCYLLGPDGQYTASPTSRVFPGLVVNELMQFLYLRGQMDENAIVERLRSWARQNLALQNP
jgi:Uma2 family endonuclease